MQNRHCLGAATTEDKDTDSASVLIRYSNNQILNFPINAHLNNFHYFQCHTHNQS